METKVQVANEELRVTLSGPQEALAERIKKMEIQTIETRKIHEAKLAEEEYAQAFAFLAEKWFLIDNPLSLLKEEQQALDFITARKAKTSLKNAVIANGTALTLLTASLYFGISINSIGLGVVSPLVIFCLAFGLNMGYFVGDGPKKGKGSNIIRFLLNRGYMREHGHGFFKPENEPDVAG